MSIPNHCECRECEDLRAENEALRDLVRDAIPYIKAEIEIDMAHVCMFEKNWLARAKKVLGEK